MLRIKDDGTDNNRYWMEIVMCDNDFTTLSIIMMILSRYDNYHDSTTNGKITEPLFLMPTILHPN